MFRQTIILAGVFFLAACASDSAGRRTAPDAYADTAELRAHNVEGLDYSIEAYDRKSPAVVFAIHGGDIEEGVSRVARAIAGPDLSLYLFQGWLGTGSRKLHLTALHFNDPAAVALATSSLVAVSVHTQFDKGERVCVGGLNKQLAASVAERLALAGFAAETPCRRLPGTAPGNLVNRAGKGGVQLEFTFRLMERLERSPADLSELTIAVREAVFDYLKKGT